MSFAEYGTIAAEAAKAAGINPGIFQRQIAQESGWQRYIVSPAGARGIAQFMPETAKSMGIDPDDPVAALYAGARLMRQNLDMFGGDYAKALAAYNAGPGAVEKYGGIPPYAETRKYVATILGTDPEEGEMPEPYDEAKYERAAEEARSLSLQEQDYKVLLSADPKRDYFHLIVRLREV